MATDHNRIIAGLDIGNNTIRVAIGKNSNHGLEIIGFGQSQAKGIRKGSVYAPESAAASILKAISEAELMAGHKAKNVIVGVADLSICSQVVNTEVTVKQYMASGQDLIKAIESAQSIKLPSDRQLLHAIPFDCVIDKITKTNQPFGMPASILKLKAHILTIDSNGIKNTLKACKLANLDPLDIKLQSLALAETELHPNEREQGVLHIDFGSGPAKVAVFSKGALIFYQRPAFSGNFLTTDVSIGLHIPIDQAEKIKRHHGCCMESIIDSNDIIEAQPSTHKATKTISRKNLAGIIEPRIREIFEEMDRGLRQSDLNGRIATGAVITGGTSSLLGMKELAKQQLNMPVRIGSLLTIKGPHDTIHLPEYSAAIGLVILGVRKDDIPRFKELKTTLID